MTKQLLVFAKRRAGGFYTVVIWTAVAGSDAWQAEQREDLTEAEMQAWLGERSLDHARDLTR